MNPLSLMNVSILDIERAAKTLEPIIKSTSMEKSLSASALCGSEVYLKFENAQRTGSFKIRGAFNKIQSLTAEEKRRGVVASSAGNHAQGVALSASLAGVESTVVMPRTASLSKIDATKSYGAQVVLQGEIYDEAFDYAKKLEKERGLSFVHPYEDEQVIAGQGTIGLEIHDAVPDLDTVIIPIGGGGLISGVSIALKTRNPQIRVVGVQSDQSPGMCDLFHGKVPSLTQRIPSIADGISIKNPSKRMYESFISKYVDEIVTVSDDEIAEAIVFLLERAKTVTEGSGAAGMAALMKKPLKLGKKVGVLLCGGNIDLNLVARIIDRGQIKRGRVAKISVVVSDLPGNLNLLTQAIAQERANVLEVHHDRVRSSLYLRETQIDFVIECTGIEHIQKVKTALGAVGAKLVDEISNYK